MKCVLMLLLILFTNSAYAQLKSQDPTCEELNQFVRKKSITSVDTLLQKMSLDSNFKEFLKGYTFAYRSFSLQHASPLEPRALVYGAHAGMVMTFINRPDSTGKDAVELMCWDEGKAQFKFAELVFNKKTVPQLRPESYNPRLCLACHGQDPRPNWDNYNAWAGFYGSKSRNSCDLIEKGTKEYDNYMTFLKTTRTKGRYAYLPKELSQDTKDKYSGDEFKSCKDIWASVNNSPKSKRQHEAWFRFNARSTHPHDDLTDELHEKNMKRVARILINHPDIEKFKYVLASLSNNVQENCGSIEEFFPQQLRNDPTSFNDEFEIAKENYFKRIEDLMEFQQWDSPLTEKHFFDHQPFLFDQAVRKNDPSRLSYLKYILRKMNLQHSRISLPFRNGDLEIALPRNTTPNGISYIESISNALEAKYSKEILGRNCEELKQNSLTALSGYVPAKPESSSEEVSAKLLKEYKISSVSAQTSQRILNTCIQCHDGFALIKLDLTNPKMISNTLQNNPLLYESIQTRLFGTDPKKRKMPLDKPLTREQAAEVMQYLQMILKK